MISATIDRHGMLILQPSNELEQYALGMWFDKNYSANLLVNAPENEKVCGSSNLVTKR
jgi:hypothetical protein